MLNPRNYLWVLLLTLAACSSSLPMNRPAESTATARCQALTSQLEYAIHKSQQRDAQYHLVDGYPLLRTNRLLVALAASVTTDQQRADWLDKAATFGLSSYQIEWQNLPSTSRERLPPEPEIFAQLQDCAWQQMKQLQQAPHWQAMIQQVKAPSEYFAGRKVLGLYPITNMAMKSGISQWQDDTRQLFNQTEPRGLPLVTWRPTASNSAVLPSWQNDSLDWPTLSSDDWQRLAQHYAPSWVLEQGGDYDRIGQPLPNADFEAKPVVYWQASVGQVHGRLLPQISYFIWFSERPKTGGLDILGGALDGVVFRVTLDEQAEPLIYDSIHPCGCHHLFFPTPNLAHCAVDESRESAFVPQAAPAGDFAVWVQSATHYVKGLKPEPANVETKVYELSPLDQLRLASESGERLYNVYGRVQESKRLERWLLWTSGLVSPGGMRQWGSHATAFSGERYFDEPGLFDTEFCPVIVDSVEINN